MPLTIDTGHATLAGLRERNEDFVGMVTPNEPDLSTKGLIAAVADGVSGNEGGREASEYTVRDVWDRPEMHHVLTRAIGLDSRLAIDHGMGELQLHDVFLLASDGLWASLSEYDITARLSEMMPGRSGAAGV
jgi:serine/threonine protein phosphatase PrpC